MSPATRVGYFSEPNVTLSPPPKETCLSIRLVWPFARLLANHPQMLEIVAKTGIGIEDFPNPDTRVPHRIVIAMLEQAVERLQDPLIGLKAGELVDPADFDVLEHAARSAANLGDAMESMARYTRLINEAAAVSIVPVGDLAEWRFRVTDGLRQPPAANDFVIASSLAFSRRNAISYEPPVEVRFMHERPAYAAEYERRFGAKASFGAPYNTIVMRRERLLVPMKLGNPKMQAAFEHQARQLLDRLEDRRSVAGRVREDVAAQFRMGSVSMHATARRLAMSVATLRRRLEEEGTTFSAIVDDLRRELAERYLGEARSAISEIAFLLGFSNVTAFGRAFKRWTGLSPTEYRATARRSA